MTEYHCRVYAKDGAEAQSTHLHVQPDQIRLTDSAYADFLLPFDRVALSLVGSGPYCVELRVQGEDLTVVLTDIDVLTEFAKIAPTSSLGRQALLLKQGLVKKHRSHHKQWLIVVAFLLAVPFLVFVFFDSTINLALTQVDPKMEGKLGQWIAQSEQFQKDSGEQRRVQAIGEKLVSKIRHVPYEFHFFVAKNTEVNACAYPGGVIEVNSALVEEASDDEIAGVVGHEIGHVLHRDTLRATLHHLGLGLSFSLFMHLIGLASDTNGLSGTHMADLMTQLESLRFSRGQESSADKEGVRLAMKAGYSGDGLIRFFEKQKEKNAHEDGAASKLTGLFSTHPLDQERIEQIKAEVEKIKAEKNDK